MSLLDSAVLALKYGFAVFPLWPRTKNPCGELVPHGVLDATTDPAQVLKWWSMKPGCNIGITGGPAGGVIVDVDSGLTSLQDAKDFASLHKFPETLAVRTGRRDAFGIQFHFTGQAVSGNYNAFGISGEMRAAHLYGLWHDSVHPVSGERYEIVIDHPRAPCPENILADFRTDGSGRIRTGGEDYPAVDFQTARERYFHLLFKASRAPKGSRNRRAHTVTWYAARAWLAGVFEEWRLFDGCLILEGYTEAEIKKQIFDAVAPLYRHDRRDVKKMLRASWNYGLAKGRLNLELYREDFEILGTLSEFLPFAQAWEGDTSDFQSPLEAKEYMTELLSNAGCTDVNRVLHASRIFEAIGHQIEGELEVAEIMRGADGESTRTDR